MTIFHRNVQTNKCVTIAGGVSTGASMRASIMSFVLIIGSALPAAAQSNTDRPGGDVAAVYVKNASECQSACSRNSRCAAWTFVKRDGHCMLKNPAPEARSDNCCDS